MDYQIEFNLYGMDEYSVQYDGDDIIFYSKDDAEKFIKEVSA